MKVDVTFEARGLAVVVTLFCTVSVYTDVLMEVSVLAAGVKVVSEVITV